MLKIGFFLITLILPPIMSYGQTVDDTLIGMVNQQLIKINKNNGGINLYQPVNGLVGSNPFRLTWCESNQCYYTLSTAVPAVLSRIDKNGNFTTLGTLTYPLGTLFMAEGLSYNRADGELYISGSLNGNPNSNPPDYHSETLLRVDTNTLTTTFIGTFYQMTSQTGEADVITFDDNGTLIYYDGQPGQYNQFYTQDISFATPPTTIYASGYDPIRDMTVRDDDVFFSLNRVLHKINIPTTVFSSVGTMFSASQFNGEFLQGITWRTLCNTAPLFGSDTTICAGQPLTLTPALTGTSYLWQDGTTNSTMDASAGGQYWVEIQDNGCTYSDTIDVTIANLPSVNLGSDTTLCFGQTLALQAPNIPGTFSWQDGSNSNSFNVTQPGTYWLSVTNDCSSDIDSITVDYVNGLNFDLGNDTSHCEGSSTLLEAPLNGDSYLWQDGSTGTSLNAINQGLYWVQVSTNGCINSDSIIITTIGAPNIDLGPNLVLCTGESALLTVNDPTASLSWSNGSSEPSITTDGDGIYSLTATNTCGSDSDSILVESEECFCEMYVPNSFSPDGDEHNNTFGPIIDCPAFDYTFEIFNRWGQVIFSSNNPFERWDGTYKGLPVQDGTYTYNIVYSTDNIVIGKTIVGHVNVLR